MALPPISQLENWVVVVDYSGPSLRNALKKRSIACIALTGNRQSICIISGCETVKANHVFETDRKRTRDLTGSRRSISSISSGGNFDILQPCLLSIFFN